MSYFWFWPCVVVVVAFVLGGLWHAIWRDDR